MSQKKLFSSLKVCVSYFWLKRQPQKLVLSLETPFISTSWMLNSLILMEALCILSFAITLLLMSPGVPRCRMDACSDLVLRMSQKKLEFRRTLTWGQVKFGIPTPTQHKLMKHQ